MIDFGASRGINALAMFQAGQDLRRKQEGESALGALAVNPGDNSAFARLAQYDPEKAYTIGQDRIKYQRQRQLGGLVQQATQGNAQANNALASLDVDTWAKIQPQMRAKIAQDNSTIGQLALAADTPEKWQAAIAQARQLGIDTTGHEDFSQRNAVLAQAGQLDNFIKSQQPHYIAVGENGVVDTNNPGALAAVARGNTPQAAQGGGGDLEAQAAAAIAAGADPAAVRARLQQMQGGAPSQGGARFP